MITVLTGANDYMRSSEVRQMTQSFIKKYGDFGVEVIDASDVDFGRILESVSSMPFLAERRMIILTSIAANKYLVANADELFDSVSESTDLLIEEAKFDKRLTLYKTIKKRAELIEFKELDESNLAKWLVAETAKREGKLSIVDANYLIRRAGINQMSLSNEINKLISFDNQITHESIEMLVDPLPSSSMFDLLDSAFASDAKQTLELYADQRKQQIEPQFIMGMIAWQIHVIAVVKYNEKLSVEDIARRSKINPYVVRKTLGLTRNLSTIKVKDLIGRAVELDARLKSESIDADDAVQMFLLSI